MTFENAAEFLPILGQIGIHSKTLRERVRHEQIERGERPWDDAAIQAIVDQCAAPPVLDLRSDDTILGYGENGSPS